MRPRDHDRDLVAAGNAGPGLRPPQEQCRWGRYGRRGRRCV